MWARRRQALHLMEILRHRPLPKRVLIDGEEEKLLNHPSKLRLATLENTPVMIVSPPRSRTSHSMGLGKKHERLLSSGGLTTKLFFAFDQRATGLGMWRKFWFAEEGVTKYVLFSSLLDTW